MANKPLQFVLVERKMTIGPQAGKIVQVAQPTSRHRVSTTFNRQEVEAVLNYATEIARDIVANGDIVEFGDLGTLKPSFKSKAIEKGKTFRAQEHIEKPVVLLSPSKKYFTLTDVSYEQTTAKAKKSTKPGETSKPQPKPNEGGGNANE